MENVKRVYVIHKTHLDIGFTDFAQEVLDRYVQEFIPQAIDTARICNTGGKKNFIWTVGSYLIHYYMEHADEAGKALMEQAIREGSIVWHALPCTTQTEMMSGDLFRFGLEIGRKLEKRFGVAPHIAAKMTDVPSHTVAIVPYLCEYGVKYLHIGINASSKPVGLPELCVWKYAEHEIILNYAGAYGKPCVFHDIALEFAHTADNMGPPTAETVWEEMNRLASVYPQAEIVSSSLDDFARAVLERKEQLPVFEMECGDTWIHGVASDPWKTAMLCELLRLGDQWKAETPDVIKNETYQAFMEYLLLVSEHTCGMDCKKYLYDFRNWDKADFQRARLADQITEEDICPAGALIHDYIIGNEFVRYTGGEFRGGYGKTERSWEEQRAYIHKAVRCLPPSLRQAAETAARELSPAGPAEMVEPGGERTMWIGRYHVTVREDGSLLLHEKAGQRYTKTILGELCYETFSAKTVEHCYLTYNRNFDMTRPWAEPDFAKPGLQYAKTERDWSGVFHMKNFRCDGNQLAIELEAEPEQAELYGSPRRACVRYIFEDECVNIRLEWFDKDANRMPEAIYFGFIFDNNDNLQLWKLQQPIDPYQVATGGNRQLHACQRIESNSYVLQGLHSPLISVGGRHLYDVGDRYGNIREGLHFVLYNNRWNTNYPVYYGQNAAFDFTLTMR